MGLHSKLWINCLSLPIYVSIADPTSFVPRGPFLESPENFLGPKSHLLNCQPLVLESRSFKIFKVAKRKIIVKFDELNALHS